MANFPKTLILLTFAFTNVQASAQLAEVPAEVKKTLDTQVELMNKQAPIEINPLQKMTHVSRNGGVILYSIETALPQDQSDVSSAHPH